MLFLWPVGARSRRYNLNVWVRLTVEPWLLQKSVVPRFVVPDLEPDVPPVCRRRYELRWTVTVMISLPDGSPLKRISAPSPRSSVAIRLLVALAIGALLYFAHAVFIPIALA